MKTTTKAGSGEPLSPVKQAYLAMQKAQGRLDALEQARTEGIAVVGIGCRMPGGVKDADGFWRLLSTGQDAVVEVPPDRWDVDAYYDPDPDAPGKMVTRYGGFLDGVDQFDAAFFGVSAREAQSLDPQKRLLMEVAQEALDDAAIPADRLSGSSGGVFVGISTADYFYLLASQGREKIDAYYSIGCASSVASGRLSYFFGLQGPSVAVDTACSSSLIAAHLACQSLRNGECDFALVAGVNVVILPEINVCFSKAHMLAPDGRCKTFSARADGYGRGEGVGVIVLKRLSDARSAGDRIRAVIRGSAVNQDGPSGGLTVPNGLAQQSVIRSALSSARLSAEEIDYLEAHGTGTPLGDPIEMGAIGAVFGNRREPLWVGSVKTNLGHLEAAAGIAGLIKTVLAVEHGEIPPHLHFAEPSSHIPWERLPVKIPAVCTPWPRTNRPRRAGVSSFGFCGTNVHVVVEESPRAEQSSAGNGQSPLPERPCHLVTVSAKGPEAFRELAHRYAEHLMQHPGLRLADVSVTSTVGRPHYRYRAAVLARTIDEAQQGLQALAQGGETRNAFRGESGETGRLAFLFSGQGAQYAGMGRGLYQHEPTFRRAIDRCQAILRDELPLPLTEVLFAQVDSSSQAPLNQTVYTQPGLFALEYALAELWQSWGIRPAWLLGHSVGEYVAACVAGVFSVEDALRLVAARARLMQELPRDGAMVAVWTDEAQALQALDGFRAEVSLAAVNGPRQVVISGRSAAVESVAKRLSEQGLRTHRLQVSHAFHSPLVEPMLARFAEVAAKVPYQVPRRSVVSNLSGRMEGPRMACAEYWCQHVRQPVRFAAGMESLFAEGARTFLEIGPQATLLGLARTCWEDRDRAGDARWLGSLHPSRPDEEMMLASLGQLYVAGEEIDWSGCEKGFAGRRISLPSYPFQHRRFWVTPSPKPAAVPVVGQPPVHPLLGAPWESAAATDWLQFDAALSPETPPYLGDHRLWTVAVYPATAYLEMALAAARRIRDEGPLELQEVAWEQALCFQEGQARRVQFIVRPEGGAYRWEAFSCPSDTTADGHPRWTRHAHGKLRHHDEPRRPPAVDLREIQSRLTDELPTDGLYARLRAAGLEYGDSFRGLARVWRSSGEMLGEVRLPAGLHAGIADYQFHPALLDPCLHVLATGLSEDRQTIAVPVGVERVELWGRPGTTIYSHGRLRDGHEQPGSQIADIELIDPDGSVVGRLTGVRLQEVRREMILAQRPEDAGRRELGDAPAAPPSISLVELKALAPAEQHDRVVAFLAEQASAVLRVGPSDKIDARQSLFQMGMDSLMGVEFIYRINRGLKVNLPAQKVIERPYLSPLADEIVARLRDTGAPGREIPVPTAAIDATETVSDNVWFPHRRIRAGARARLFCFHGPVGTAAAFAGWAGKLPGEIEVCPVELPGCGSRATEAPIGDPDALVDTLCEVLLDQLDRPFALFGDGDGAELTLRLACQVQQRFGLCPMHVFFGAGAPPEGRERGGLECSATAFWPRNDSTLGREALFEWRRHVSGDFRVESLPAGRDDYLADAGRLPQVIARDMMEALAR